MIFTQLQKGTLSPLSWRSLRISAGFVTALAVLLPNYSAQARVVENPQPAEIEYLYRFLANDPPNFEVEAKKLPEYYRADEFDKAQVLTQIEQRLRGLYHGAADISVLRLRTSGRFSDYDSSLGAYKFDLFKPGTFFPFGNYGVTMENAEDFRNWELPVDQAKAMRNKAKYGQVVFEIDIKPFGASPSRRNAIRGQIVGLKVFLKRNNELVLEKTLAADQQRSVAAAKAPEDIKPIAQEQVAIQGLSIGMTQKEAKAWAKEVGLTLNDNPKLWRVSTNDEALTYQPDIERIMVQQNTGNRFADGFQFAIFGPKLDCRTKSDAYESCGLIHFSEDEQVQSAILLQNISGQTKQQIIDALIKRYGAPSDQLNVQLMERYRATQLVWGVSSKDLKEVAVNLTEVSGPAHWQIEAVLTQADNDRYAVFVQINQIGEVEKKSGGWFKF